jgi:hypothetical protein
LVIILPKILLGCPIKKHEPDETSRTYGGEEKFIQGFSRSLIDNLEDLGMNERIILICICNKLDRCTDWIEWLSVGTGGGFL